MKVPVAKGFAAVNQHGCILPNTVSLEKRGAMVNWLVAHDGLMVCYTDSDARIEHLFTERAVHRGMAYIAAVEITVTE